MFFMATQGKKQYLWKSDGTANGTVIVNSKVTFSSIGWGGSTNNTFFFPADGHFWKSDGTSSGTIKLASNINPGGAGVNMFGINGQMFFSGSTSKAGRELWTSDGTPTGTYMVQDINPGTSGANPSGYLAVNGTILFRATDATHGTELWRIDDTSSMAPLWTGPGTTPTAPAPIVIAPQSSYLAMLAALPDDNSAPVTNMLPSYWSTLLAVGMP